MLDKFRERKNIKNVTRAEYSKIHHWLKKNFGKSDMCENPNCDKKSTIYQWALKNDCEYELNRENFMKLCRSCHSKYDITDNTRKMMSERMQGVKTKRKDIINCASCGIKIVEAHSSQKYCKDCALRMYDEDDRRYRENNKEYTREYKKLYREKNREVISEKMKEYYRKKVEGKKQFCV